MKYKNKASGVDSMPGRLVLGFSQEYPHGRALSAFAGYSEWEIGVYE